MLAKNGLQDKEKLIKKIFKTTACRANAFNFSPRYGVPTVSPMKLAERSWRIIYHSSPITYHSPSVIPTDEVRGAEGSHLLIRMRFLDAKILTNCYAIWDFIARNDVLIKPNNELSTLHSPLSTLLFINNSHCSLL